MKIAWDAILWWEKRRIPYNLIILVAGVIAIALIEVVGGRLVHPGEDAIEPVAMLIGVVAYALAANLCYTFSWITEIAWSQGDTSRTESPALQNLSQRSDLLSSSHTGAGRRCHFGMGPVRL